MKPLSPRRLYSWLPALLVVLIGVSYAIITSTLNLLGDDLSFYIRTEEFSGSRFYLFPKHIVNMWLATNGRIQNVIAPFLFQYVPWFAVAVLNGAMTALLFWFTLKWCRLRSVAGNVAVIALMAFALPWWDVFLLIDVNVGYAWGMAIILVFLWYLFERQTLPTSFWGRFALCLLAFIAGGIHEAAGLTLLGALVIYYWFTDSWRTLSTTRKWMLAALGVGVFYCASSPGIWMRFGAERIVDGPWWELLLGSSSFVLVFIVAALVIFLWRREVIIKLLRTPWSVFALMGVFSMPIVVAGGIIGRSGFFGQGAALIALCWMLREAFAAARLRTGVGVAFTLLLGAAVAIHYVEFVRHQLRLNEEVRTVIADYEKSPDGAVYIDFTNEPDMPWYLLYKTRGVPDEDDFYLSTTLTKFLGTSDRPFTVLPADLRGINADTLTRDLPLPKGYATLREIGEEMPQSAGRRLVTTPGKPDSIAVPIPGTHAYYVTARDLDPSGSY